MGQDFTYDMTQLALYYRQYHEVMQHWHVVLPARCSTRTTRKR